MPGLPKTALIGNASSKFENHINKAINFFYAVKPCAVYKTMVILPPAKIDSVPTTRRDCVVYKYLCRCESPYVGRTTEKLPDRI